MMPGFPFAGIQWSTKTPLPQPRWRGDAFAIDGKIWVAGGGMIGEYSHFAVYNPASNSWSTHDDPFPNDPQSLSDTRRFISTSDGKVYCIGSNDHEHGRIMVFRYDTVENKLKRFEDMLKETLLAGVVMARNGKIYVIGGFDKSVQKEVNCIQELDPVTDTWRYRTPMPAARYDLGAVAVGDKIYVIGGHADWTPQNRVEVYDTVTDSWEEKAPLPQPLRCFQAVASSGFIYTVGGLLPCHVANEIYRYHIATNSWNTMQPMSEERFYPAVTLFEGKIYAIGGVKKECTGNGDEIKDVILNTVEAGRLPMVMSPPHFEGIHQNNIFQVEEAL